MKKILAALLLSGTLLTISIAGKPAKLATCTACHGQSGLSSNPQWPNLAGQTCQLPYQTIAGL